ncbi:MAG: HNH endonuclease [Methanosarcinales archaeon]|nr:HNH endonuclease [Methanosarcinales archaeon]
MAGEDLSIDLVELLASLPSKRARVVVKHISEHGFITTEDLESKYGYKHPPRAVRDVREAGIPLDTFNVKSSDRRNIAAYRFGDLSKINKDKLGGRKTFSKKFKQQLYESGYERCAICMGKYHSRYLQIDHRIPYEIAGDSSIRNTDSEDYMLLCGSCNRAKSWSCEHCANWLTEKSDKICFNCYWAHPENYIHIALREIRRIEIIWDEEDVAIYEKLKTIANKHSHSIPDYVKKIIESHLLDDRHTSQ